MLVSRLWEMAQIIQPGRSEGLSSRDRLHSPPCVEVGSPRFCFGLLAIAASLGVVAIAAKSSDLAGAALPPPYRGAAGSIVVRVGLETDLRRVSIPCCERVWVEHGGTRRSIDGGFEVTPGGEAKQPIYKLQTGGAQGRGSGAGAGALARTIDRRAGAA